MKRITIQLFTLTLLLSSTLTLACSHRLPVEVKFPRLPNFETIFTEACHREAGRIVCQLGLETFENLQDFLKALAKKAR